LVVKEGTRNQKGIYSEEPTINNPKKLKKRELKDENRMDNYSVPRTGMIKTGEKVGGAGGGGRDTEKENIGQDKLKTIHTTPKKRGGEENQREGTEEQKWDQKRKT